MSDDAAREFLRHTLATLAYRGGKVIRDAPPSFADLKVSETSRTPIQVLAHIGDLFDWAVAIALGKQAWNEAKPEKWDWQVERFFTGLASLDAVLASEEPLGASVETLFQGPIADALTHIGQLAMLRRIHGVAVRGENYFKAEITAGRVGRDQVPPKREFD